MDSLARQSRDLLLKSTQRYLNAVWYEEIFKPYDATIHGRYPVFKDSQRDMSLTDFSDFFGPKGAVTRYIETYLTPFIDTQSIRWRVRQKDGSSIQLASTVLTELERAQVIRKLFFKTSPYPKVAFSLKPIDKHPKLEVSFQYGGHTYYEKENSLAWPLTWPILSAEHENTITFQLQNESGSRLTRSFTGVWTWFRLLDDTACDREKIPLNFTIQINPYTVHYQLCPEDKEHPFIKGIIERFRCPARLTI